MIIIIITIIIIIIINNSFAKGDVKGKRLLKKATLRGICDVRGKLPFRLNKLSLNFRRKLLIFIAQISSLV